MEGIKYDTAAVVNCKAAEEFYEIEGIAMVVTDGRYIQIENEKEEK